MSFAPLRFSCIHYFQTNKRSHDPFIHSFSFNNIFSQILHSFTLLLDSLVCLALLNLCFVLLLAVGVSQVDANWETKEVVVSGDKDKMDTDAVTAAIKKTGKEITDGPTVSD